MGRRSTTPETPPEDETPEEPEVTEVRVLSTIHPNLLITAPKVEFADGVAIVSPETAATLAAAPREWGLRFEEPPTRGDQDDG